jgi:hypothetical protein
MTVDKMLIRQRLACVLLAVACGGVTLVIVHLSSLVSF